MTHADLARSLYLYDKHTGILRWRKDRIVALKNHKTIKAHAGAIAGWFNDSGYRCVMFMRRKRRATAVIWLIVHGRYPKKEIDHVNGKTGDDRLVNLREATPRQNRYNTKLRADNKSGHKGVSWSNQRQLWRVTIKVDGKQKHLGFYPDAEQAGAAYASAAPKYHGEFARLK